MRIRNLKQLNQAAWDKKAVVVPDSCNFSGRRPAAFMLNLQGGILYGLFSKGMYIYKKRGKKNVSK